MIITKIFKIIALIILISVSCPAKEIGSATGLPLPRFVTLKSGEVNLRKGPNMKYPIVWTYKSKGYPIEVVAEFENWRKLRDQDGSEGWTHENLISGNRNAVINNNYYINKPNYTGNNNELIIFRYPDESSYPMVRIEFGVIVGLKKCQVDWCKVKVNDITGWVNKKNLWGVYPDEIIG
jgi:SH3-like domain-containing protein